MHLIEAQATQVGQSIDKPFIYEKYFAHNFDKYIVLAPYSKDAKNYDLYQNVLHILSPILNKNNIKIVQIGAANEKPIPNTHYIAGQTSINQVAYLIKHALLFFGADSYGQHLAGHYNIPLVDLVSNNYANVVRPYFGDKKKQIILEPLRNKDEKPSFSLQEQPKTINKISPEKVAESICQLLNLEYDWPYEQVYLGDVYTNKMIESSVESVANNQQFGTDSFIMRMDYNHNEEILKQQMQVCPCSILTNKPINEDIFKMFKGTGRIKEIVYLIEENNSPEFARMVIRYAIPFRMVSSLPQEKIDSFKINYFEIGVIFKKIEFDVNKIDALKNEDKKNLYYQSSKFIIGKDKIYSSRAALLENKSVNSIDDILPIIDTQVFWDDLDTMRILKKKNV